MAQTPASHPDNPDRARIAEALIGASLPLPIHSTPLLEALDAQILSVEEGRITLHFAPGAEHVQGGGVVAGGVTATMLDFALAFAGLSICGPGESVASVGLNVQFLAPVRPGPVTATARLVTRGYRVAQASGELLDPSGSLLAAAQSPLSLKRRP